jgi:MFS family permease
MRRLLILSSAMVFLDVAFFAAIAPLLPTYVDELGLSKAAAGILSASYAAGTLVAALPAGLVASRAGARRTTIFGLVLLGFASFAFGLFHDIVLLDSARFVQGCAGALIWSGALTWLITEAPEERRGAVIGTALGTAVAGALLGPALGALAVSIGTEPVFGAVLVVALGLAWVAARTPDVGIPERQSLRDVGRALRSRPVVDAALFVGVPSVMFGAFEVLVPLRIDALGGGNGVIAGGFIAGAAVEASLAPISGRLADRVGSRIPYVVGLGICAVTMVILGVAALIGVMLVAMVVTSVGAGLCFAPAMTLVSDTAETAGLHQGFAAGLSNMAWASGQVLGGIGGGAAAEAFGNAAPSIAIAVLLAATVVYAYRALTPMTSLAAGG